MNRHTNILVEQTKCTYGITLGLLYNVPFRCVVHTLCKPCIEVPVKNVFKKQATGQLISVQIIDVSEISKVCLYTLVVNVQITAQIMYNYYR